MTDEIQSLIDSLRRGQFEDPAEKISLLSAALQEQNADLTLLLSLIRAPQIPLRLAAMEACRDRKDPELLEELSGLSQHPEVRIRVKLAEILRLNLSKAAARVLRDLLHDQDPDVREAAIKSTASRPEFRTAQETCLKTDIAWSVRFAALFALKDQSSPVVVEAMFQVLHDDDTGIANHCAEIIEKRLNDFPDVTQKHLTADISRLSRVEKKLKEFGAHAFPKLMSWLTDQTTVRVDPEALTRFGTDLTALAASGDLPRAYHFEEPCETILKYLQRDRWRSIVLLGQAGVGKTAVVNELVHHLAKPENGSWRVLRVSPTDFMSGTRYLGEWESKVRDLVETIRKPRRVLLYVPNLSDLSAVGTWSKSESSVATALAPYLEEGSIILIGESTPEEYERGFGRVPSLRRLMDKISLTEATIERTRSIVTSIRDEQGSNLSDQILDQIVEISGQFLGHVGRPGNAVELIRAVIKAEKQSSESVTFRDVLDALSTSTGIPPDLLDDAIPLQERQIKEFFEKRVIGQPEAVEAVVDLVTLIKAGVTDPNKPFGVFLFVGPTGVGKTELARALAEFIFGDAARLKRFDMSEFANSDGFTRLIGGNNENGLLTDAVRQHPFSVVLLDEIEKANVNVFDLCLQIFDAGRLTDGRGRTVDFRRTIVILTSNVGASVGLPPPGFLTPAAAPGAAVVDKERTFRELSRFFRPEFLNRLDRIIQFRPLSLQVAEQIARREVDVVLQRSGIRRRNLVVEVDPGVVSLLVREGYSPHFGARPLKRTVERLLLLPLARAISSGSLRGRTVLRLAERNGRVQATITAPPAVKQSETKETSRAPQRLATRSAELKNSYEALEPAIRILSDRKSELMLKTQDGNFFRNTDLRTATFTEIHNLDHFLNLHHAVGRSVKAVVDDPVAEKLVTLTSDVEYLTFVARCRDAAELGDAIVSISLVDRIGSAQNAVEKVAGMYQSLAERRRMTVEVLGEFYNSKDDRVYMLVAGLGAFGLLKNECGLHQIDRRYKERAARTGREIIREDRELLRVEVFPVGPPSKQFQQQVKSKVSTLRPSRQRLVKANLALTLFHEPSVRSIELWTAGPQEDALERALSILHADLQPRPDGADGSGIIRQYDVGMGAKVKDHRTGRTTTRVKQVFNGDLDPFLFPDASTQ